MTRHKHKMSRNDVLQHALRIAGSYATRGLTLTLRQLYYRFVAEGLFPSGQAHYKRLGDVLTDARYSGAFPIHLLVDRGRDVHHCVSTRDAAHGHLQQMMADGRDAIEGLPTFLAQRDRWLDQANYVSVWVEKQALEGVFENPCTDLGVGLFACKGYPSVSGLFDWLKHAYFACHGVHPDANCAMRKSRRFRLGPLSWLEPHRSSKVKECVVLYFGDHDPDGWEIPRSAERGLRTLMATYEMYVPLRFKRVALNMDQVAEYNPPPFDAKDGARHQGYIEEHGTDKAWELDALDPDVLQTLIRDEVDSLFNYGIYESHQVQLRSVQRDLARALGADHDDGEE